MAIHPGMLAAAVFRPWPTHLSCECGGVGFPLWEETGDGTLPVFEFKTRLVTRGQGLGGRFSSPHVRGSSDRLSRGFDDGRAGVQQKRQ